MGRSRPALRARGGAAAALMLMAACDERQGQGKGKRLMGCSVCGRLLVGRCMRAARQDGQGCCSISPQRGPARQRWVHVEKPQAGTGTQLRFHASTYASLAANGHTWVCAGCRPSCLAFKPTPQVVCQLRAGSPGGLPGRIKGMRLHACCLHVPSRADGHNGKKTPDPPLHVFSSDHEGNKRRTYTRCTCMRGQTGNDACLKTQRPFFHDRDGTTQNAPSIGTLSVQDGLCWTKLCMSGPCQRPPLWTSARLAGYTTHHCLQEEGEGGFRHGPCW